MDEKTYDEPSAVTADDGAVSVKGPDAVDVKLTPDAADETGDRLLEGARAARMRGQPGPAKEVGDATPNPLPEDLNASDDEGGGDEGRV